MVRRDATGREKLYRTGWIMTGRGGTVRTGRHGYGRHGTCWEGTGRDERAPYGMGRDVKGRDGNQRDGPRRDWKEQEGTGRDETGRNGLMVNRRWIDGQTEADGRSEGRKDRGTDGPTKTS